MNEQSSCPLSRRGTLALALAAFANETANPQQRARRTFLYAAIGPKLLQYDVDLGACTLIRRDSVTNPANVQEAWASPSKQFLYVAWSDGGASYLPPDGGAGPAGHRHGISAYRIDAASGVLTHHGQSISLPSRPIYITTDMDGAHVIGAHNIPSALTVHRILPDGTLGEEVKQKGKLDFGIYGHQVRMDPSNQTVILVTRGNAPTATQTEDPGALKLFGYKNGVLSNRQTVAPNNGINYQIRHIDFHPSGKWDYAALERQNTLHTYRRLPDGTLNESPIFTNSTVADRFRDASGQAASSIHVHPNGGFVYVANRASGTVDFEGRRVSAGGENTIAAFSINQDTGEPTLIQSAETRGFQPRTFAMDATGTVLVAANQSSALVRRGSSVQTIPASLTTFRIRDNGKLDFAHQYEFETGGSRSLFWTGIVSLG